MIGHGGTVDKALDLDLHAFMESKALGFLFYSELMGREMLMSTAPLGAFNGEYFLFPVTE